MLFNTVSQTVDLGWDCATLGITEVTLVAATATAGQKKLKETHSTPTIVLEKGLCFS